MAETRYLGLAAVVVLAGVALVAIRAGQGTRRASAPSVADAPPAVRPVARVPSAVGRVASVDPPRSPAVAPPPPDEAARARDGIAAAFADATLSAPQQREASERALAASGSPADVAWLAPAQAHADAMLQTIRAVATHGVDELRRECFRGGCLVQLRHHDGERLSNAMLKTQPGWPGDRVIFPPEADPATGGVVQTVLLLAPRPEATPAEP